MIKFWYKIYKPFKNIMVRWTKMKRDFKIKIENVVASTQIGENIDLNKIAREIKDAEYKPKQFL